MADMIGQFTCAPCMKETMRFETAPVYMRGNDSNGGNCKLRLIYGGETSTERPL